MLASPHPSLRFADVRIRRRTNLVKFYLPNDLRLAYNARAALFQLLESLRAGRRRTVLLPAFHCTALVEPVPRAGFKTDFYRILPDFRPDMEDLSRRMSGDVAAVIVIHYFGFVTPLEPFLKLKENFGCHIVEDCAHSFLSQIGSSYVGHQGDFSLYSFYKFSPCLTGGGLGINCEQAVDFPNLARIPWKENLVLAKRLFEQMLQNAPENLAARFLLHLERWRVNRRRSQPLAVSHSALVDDPYLFREDLARSAMPGFSRHILESTDWNKNMAARRRNYAILSEEIVDRPGLTRVFSTLPVGVCPWAFPILLENRRAHEERLRAAGVPLFTFGEILHPLLLKQNDEARHTAEHLSERLFLLPVHAQLSEGVIREIARRLNTYAALPERTGKAQSEQAALGECPPSAVRGENR